MRTFPTRRMAGWAVLVALCLLAAACAENEIGADGSPADTEDQNGQAAGGANDGSTGADNDGAAGGGDGSADTVSEARQWAIDYVGGSAAEATGEPIKIGFGYTPDGRNAQLSTAEATVAYINNRLGGIDGRPLMLVPCSLAAQEDGGACGNELANDPEIVAVVGGGMTVGNDWFWLVLSEAKPLLQSIPLTAVDLLTPVAPAYTSGALGAAVGAGVYLAEDVQPQRIALLVIDNDAGRGGVPIFRTVLDAAGVDLTETYVPGDATAPEVEAALAAVDAANADYLALALFEDGCIATIDAIRSSGIETPVVAIPTCWAEPVRQHLRDTGAAHDIPNGWTFASSYNPFDTSVGSGIPTFLEIVGPDNAEEVTNLAATYVSAGLLSMARALNAVDGDFSRSAIDAEIRSHTGPHPFQIGQLQCDQFSLFKSICAREVGIWQFQDGEWRTIRGEGDTIDIGPALESLDFGG